MFFEALTWAGEPINAEPHKCARIAWWPLDHLPSNTYPHTAAGIEQYRKGEPYAAVWWHQETVKPKPMGGASPPHAVCSTFSGSGR